MEDEMFTMMLVLLFAAVMIVAGQVFIDQRKRAEVAIFVTNLALAPTHAPTK
jgi:hypothetical protein